MSVSRRKTLPLLLTRNRSCVLPWRIFTLQRSCGMRSRGPLSRRGTGNCETSRVQALREHRRERMRTRSLSSLPSPGTSPSSFQQRAVFVVAAVPFSAILRAWLIAGSLRVTSSYEPSVSDGGVTCDGMTRLSPEYFLGHLTKTVTLSIRPG
jgi:hypothetical protein